MNEEEEKRARELAKKMKKYYKEHPDETPNKFEAKIISWAEKLPKPTPG